MATIEQLLHRRSGLSTFLVHLTRDWSGSSARDNLLSIANGLRIEAKTALGPAAHLEPHLAGSGTTQRVVCFTETPLEHAWMMTRRIDGRSVHFAPYGLVFTKTTARKAHCNPVWYTDISTRGGRDWPMRAVNDLVAAAVSASSPNGPIDSALLCEQPILRLTPFLEQMGPTGTSRKEFWWEREWRHVDDYPISFPSQVVAFLVPEGDHAQFEADLTQIWPYHRRPLLDPEWGLERMIAALADIGREEAGPFPVA